VFGSVDGLRGGCSMPTLLLLPALQQEALDCAAALLAAAQVRFCRDRFSPTGELGCRGVRGAVGLGYRFTV
jgi:hypothetical protein